jgi:hypothetical protein
MFTFNFYKIASQWYMDDPDYLESGGNPAYLDVVGGMNDLLEFVAQGRSAVQLIADLTPFEGAEAMVLMEPSGGGTGGYYKLHTLKGQVVDQEFWLNELVYYYFKELPQTIYASFN